MSLLNFKKRELQVELISDLDAMIAKPVGFKLHGRVHQINPIALEEFYKFANAWTRVVSWKESDSIKPDEYLDGLTSLFSSVCPSINRQDVEKLTQAQAAGLFELILETVTGKAHTKPDIESGEKKN